ncbi:hypothetical protein L484_019684 [Morus notabilis]|uniref:FAS1 domain-containing protein n=1 Tax=Morus notabilis TaxID=981085 RepID=W9QN09_9ROSA|nr:FAS1 domain-containing protein SELMODRAFT_448915 [Morus notabilis]EXB29159.1 hypothetical protein L484_019684 [Morus notabilis]
MATVLSISAADIPFGNRNQDLVAAISEMQRANYFTFITLLNMASLDHRLQGNLTFLMPNDRMLSIITLQQDAVSEFLLRHSIPSTMLFDYLQHIPTGSIIPSSKPEYMLKISNKGRRSFFLNNARLISPNICTASSSIRCHGIDGVLSEASPKITVNNNYTITNPSVSCSCSSNSTSNPASRAIPPSPFPPLNGFNLTPASALPPTGANVPPPKSGSSLSVSGGLSTFSVTSSVIVATWVLSLSFVP